MTNSANVSIEENVPAQKKRILALCEQSFGLRNNNSEYAKEYASEALREAQRLGFEQGIAEAFFARGVAYTCSAGFNLALQNLSEAGEHFRALQDKNGQCRVARWIGIAYRNIGMYLTSIEYFSQALNFAEDISNKALTGYALMNLGDSYVMLNEPEKAASYRQQALTMASEAGDLELKSQALWSIGRDFEVQGKFEEAYSFFRESYDIRTAKNDALGAGTSLFGMASALSKQGFPAKALRIYLELWQNFKSGFSGVPQTEAFILLEIGRVYVASAKPDRALKHFERALEIAHKVSVPALIASANESLAKYHKKAGNFEIALQYHEEFHRINAELAQRESKQSAQYFRQAFEFEKTQKEAEIYRLRNEELADANAQNERLLLNVLPEAVAKRIKAGETTIAERFNDVTVMFADIVGFTELSARESPEKVVDILNRIFSAFDIFSEQYNLEKIKTIGDAYMIVGGVPKPCDDHAESVAKMALEMQATVRLLAKSMGFDLAIRVGIHSGAVVAGVIGQKKFSYDLWGDTVNIASRMESHGEAGKIHCTEEVAMRLAGQYIFEERGFIDIKGKGQMKTYFLLSAH